MTDMIPADTASAGTMRAVSLRHGKLGLHEVPRPTPGPGQILVRTLACAICASDHHYMDHPETSREDRTGMRVDAPEEHVIMGHEYCAEVVAYGPETQQAWPIGTRVTSPPALFVENGMRIIGMAPDAPGGFGEFFLLSEGLAKPLPDHVDPAVLALIDAMAVGWYYTRIGTQEPDRAALVVGLGAIGLSVVAALKQRGVETIVASDFNPARRELAARLGATVLNDPALEPALTAWRRAAWGAPEEVHDRLTLMGLPRCAVYECVGAEGVLGNLMDQCPNDTRIMAAGGVGNDTIPTAVAHLKGVNLQLGGGPAIEDWYETLDLVVEGAIDPTPLFGERVALDDLADAVDRARRPDAAPRIIFTS